jgi:UDP-N-acetylglucosamine/UDP-N-acetylgalactosamine 4-epimerase
MTDYEELQEYLENNQSTWLVTGVAGFIGSNLLEKLLILNQKVVGLDNFITGYQHNIDKAIEDAEKTTSNSLSKNFTFINGDIRELKDCQQACNGVDYVLHQAALGSVPRSIEDPINTNSANIDGFLNMLVATRDAKVKRFVYAASSSAYGDISDLPKIEDNIGSPLNTYAVTKIVNELYASVFERNYGLESIGLRYFNIFGKRQDPDGSYAAVIPKWIYGILNNENIFINGDGNTSRDFCYIDNVVQVNLLSATTTYNKEVSQVYNVALGEQTTLNELYFLIKNIVAKRTDFPYAGKLLHRDFRDGDILHSLADINKAKVLLNYHPEQDFLKGIEKTIHWFIETIKSNSYK